MSTWTDEAIRKDPVLFALSKKFGSDRVQRVMDHEWKRRDHRARQYELIAVAYCMLLLWFATSLPLHLIALLFIQIGTAECKRMNACGRPYRSKRSMEVIGI